MKLLPSQKTDLYNIIEEKGLSPAQFEIEQPSSEGETITRLTHKESGFYFVFDTEMRGGSEFRHVAFSPGITTMEDEDLCNTWVDQRNLFRDWVRYLFRELNYYSKIPLDFH